MEESPRSRSLRAACLLARMTRPALVDRTTPCGTADQERSRAGWRGSEHSSQQRSDPDSRTQKRLKPAPAERPRVATWHRLAYSGSAPRLAAETLPVRIRNEQAP